MSLLGTQVFANPTTPIWLGTNGGTIDGLVTINGSLEVQGVGEGLIRCNELLVQGEASAQEYGFLTPLNLPALSSLTLLNPGLNTETLIVSSAQQIDFVKGPGGANTSLILSAPGSGLDNLTVGGVVGAQSFALGAQAAGTGAIPVGQTNVVIPSTKVTASSLVFLSHTGTGGGPGNGPAQGNLTYRPPDIVPGVSFTVYLTNELGIGTAASNTDATFVWMIVN